MISKSILLDLCRTQGFRKSRQEPTYRTVAELDADLNRAEEEGRVTQVEYEMGTI